MSSLDAFSKKPQSPMLRTTLALARLSQSPHLTVVAFEYFQTQIRPSSRAIAISSLKAFVIWLEGEALTLDALRAGDVARFIEDYPAEDSRRRGVLSFLRGFLGYLEVKGILDRNAAGSVKHLKNPYRLGGVTPALSITDAKRLLECPEGTDSNDIRWLRDRALIATLLETWGRVGAVCEVRVSDFYVKGGQSYLRLKEKDMKVELKEVSSGLSSYIREYLDACPSGNVDSFLFRSAKGRGSIIYSEMQFQARNARAMLKQRAEAVGLRKVQPHMLRVTGMNVFRDGGGSRTDARKKMGHQSEGMVVYYER